MRDWISSSLSRLGDTMKYFLPISLMLVGTTTLAAMLNGVGGGSVIINGVEQSADSDTFIEADTNALAQMTNYVSWKSNNTYDAGTTQRFISAIASNLVLFGNQPVLNIYPDTNGSHNIFSVRLTNLANHASGAGITISVPDESGGATKGLANFALESVNVLRLFGERTISISGIMFGNGLMGSGFTRASASGGTNCWAVARYISGDASTLSFAQSDARNSAMRELMYMQVSLGSPANNQWVVNGATSNQFAFMAFIGTNQQNLLRMNATNNTLIIGSSAGALYNGAATNATVQINTNQYNNRQSIEAAGQIKTRDAFFTSYSGIATLTSGVCIVTLPYVMTTTNYHPFCFYIGQTADLSTSLVNRAITITNFTIAGDARGTNFHWTIVGEISR